MSMRHGTASALLILLAGLDASAQFPVPVLVPSGVRFQYRSRNLQVGGFLNTGYSVGTLYPVVPYGPVLVYPQPTILPAFGVVQSTTTIHILAPSRPRYVPEPEPDTSGVDLDLVAPPWAPKKVVVPQLGPAKVQPLEPLPVDESLALLQAGVAAFRAEQIGLAGQRFRQATEANPNNARAFFFHAQALLALGKYHEAYDRIARGLTLEPGWAKLKFPIKAELYADALWIQQGQALAEALMADPASGKLLFLSGYQRWFAGQEAQALVYFTLAKEKLANAGPADLFLNAVPAKVAQK